MIQDGKAVEFWAYGYASHETNPWTYVPIVNLFFLGSGNLGQSQSAGLGVYFDDAGIVRSISHTKTDVQLGGIMTLSQITTDTRIDTGSQKTP